ncbi:hypothetical protein HDV63DRAFT_97349 [Trichoderma sp. SZMC 28014]
MHLSITNFFFLQVNLLLLPGGVKTKVEKLEQIKHRNTSQHSCRLWDFFSPTSLRVSTKFFSRDVSEASFLASRPDQGNLKKTCSELFSFSKSTSLIPFLHTPPPLWQKIECLLP